MTTVTPADFEQFYHLMEQSFPPSERRSAAGQHALLADPAYRLFLHKDTDGALMALLACWDFDSFSSSNILPCPPLAAASASAAGCLTS